jgi:hypothetical protein
MAARAGCRRLWQFAVRNARFLQSHSAKQPGDRHYTTVAITALSAFTGYAVYRAVGYRTNAAREDATRSQPQVIRQYIKTSCRWTYGLRASIQQDFRIRTTQNATIFSPNSANVFALFC